MVSQRAPREAIARAAVRFGSIGRVIGVVGRGLEGEWCLRKKVKKVVSREL